MREREGKNKSRPEAADPTPSSGSSPHEQILGLQRSAGNAAVAAALSRPVEGDAGLPAVLRQPGPVVAPAGPAVEHHTAAQLLAMTLNDFNEFAERQADWHADPALPAADKRKLRRLLQFAREETGGRRPILAGCGGMTVQSLVDTGLGADVRGQLRRYGAAVAKVVPTVELRATTDVAKAQDYARALAKLERTPGGPIIKKIIRQDEGKDQLGDLMRAGAIDDFIGYCRTCRPILHADNGAEIRSYLAMRAEGVSPTAYKARLPGVRNLHRFEKAALDQLARNRADTSKAKPLTVILHSAFDHNGAFHRDPNLTAVVTDARNLTLMIEGAQSLAAISGQLAPLARRYGQGNRISQAMLAGHGNAQVIEMAGTVGPDGLTREDNVDIAGNRAHTDAFFQELIRNMSTNPDSRIVLNACLTASNAVTTPLDADPARAAAQVQAAITADPSLATHLQNMATAAGSPTNVLGANASFGQVGLMDPATGRLDIRSARDPAMTASKATYVRQGTEPQGALRAVLEVWAADRTASPVTTTCEDAMRQRLSDPASTAWNEVIIRSLYRTVLANLGSGELIRQLGDTAGSLSELVHEPECRVGKVTIPSAHANTIFADLTTSPRWTSTARIRLVVYQIWMATDATKRASILTDLATFTCTTGEPFVDIDHLETGGHMAAMLPLAEAAAPSRGRLVLSLLGVAGATVNGASRNFLREVVRVGGRSGFDPALNIDDVLDGFSDRGTVERTIGVGAALPPPPPGGGGPAAPAPNVDLDGDGTNDFYVEPMTRQGAVVAHRLNVRERPGLTEPVVAGLDAGDSVYVIGKSTDWYAIEHRGHTRFVHQTWVRLSGRL